MTREKRLPTSVSEAVTKSLNFDPQTINQVRFPFSWGEVSYNATIFFM